MTQTHMPIRIRPAAKADEAFILSSWKLSYLDAPINAWARATESGRGAYYAYMNAQLPRIMAQARTIVAHNPIDNEHLFGWACATANLVHYVYVKSDYRRDSIAERLLTSLHLPRDCDLVATAWTSVCEEQRYCKAQFAPGRLGDAA